MWGVGVGVCEKQRFLSVTAAPAQCHAEGYEHVLGPPVPLAVTCRVAHAQAQAAASCAVFTNVTKNLHKKSPPPPPPFLQRGAAALLRSHRNGVVVRKRWGGWVGRGGGRGCRRGKERTELILQLYSYMGTEIYCMVLYGDGHLLYGVSNIERRGGISHEVRPSSDKSKGGGEAGGAERPIPCKKPALVCYGGGDGGSSC